MASLMPLQRNISPHKGPPRLRPFDPEEFLKTIETSGPHLTSGLKGDWVGLYRRFFRSAHFEGWLRYRQQEVNQKLQALHVEALCQAVGPSLLKATSISAWQKLGLNSWVSYRNEQSMNCTTQQSQIFCSDPSSCVENLSNLDCIFTIKIIPFRNPHLLLSAGSDDLDPGQAGSRDR